MPTFQSAPDDYKVLAGSYKIAPDLSMAGELNPNEVMEITIRLRQKPGQTSSEAKAGMSFKEYEKQFGAAKKDMQRVEAFACKNQLSVAHSSSASRSLQLKGRIKDFEKIFHVNLAQYYDPERGLFFRGRMGWIYVPADLHEMITGVFGLDNRQAARPMFQVAKKDGKFISLAQAPQSYSPDQVADIYNFPEGASGANQTIGIIELGGGYRPEDLNNYFDGLGIKTPSFKAVSVDGAINSPSTANSADGEVMLDMEVAGAVAPDAKLVVYFAPNSDKGFLDAITRAIHDEQNQPSVISISYGAPEENWTKQSLNSYNDVFKAASRLGVTICTAAGDRGSADNINDGKVHADFPSSSPFNLSCGGTKLEASDGKIASEIVWNESNSSATGGGVSVHFGLPDYQQNIDVPANVSNGFKGRGLPDVAGNADPRTGYQVLVDGQQLVIGGTSAVAPLMAALVARINQQRDENLGFINPGLYADPSGSRDIIKGNNITTSTDVGYEAGPGWDACTGWGVLSDIPEAGKARDTN